MASRTRRRLLAWPLAAMAPSLSAPAQPRQPADVLRVGADSALIDSGLAKRLQQAFGRDTGIGVHLVRSPVLPMLDALERGELDAAFANAPSAEDRLVAQGLAYDRQPIARGEFVIVGPAPHRKARDPAGIAGGHDAVSALTAIRDAAVAAPGGVAFMSAGDGSGTHVAEQALWRQARIAPEAAWYVTADPGAGVIAQAGARGAYALVERGAWRSGGAAALAILVDGDAQLLESVHVLRGFRSAHPAGKLFVAWAAGPKGRRVVAEHLGYRVADA